MDLSVYDALLTMAVVLATLAMALLVFIRHKLKYWQGVGVPCLPPQTPCGHVTDLFMQRASMAEIVNKTYREMKALGHRYAGFYIFTNALFIPLDNKLVKTMMTANFWTNFSDKGIYYNEKSDPLSAHLFSLRLKKWRPLRAKLTPAFTSGKMKEMFHILTDCGQKLNGFLQKMETEIVEIKDVAARYTINGIGSCAFGIECDSFENPDDEFLKYGRKAFNPPLLHMIKAYFSFSFPKLMLFLNANLTETVISDFFMGVVKSTMAYRESNNVQRKDFFNLLLQMKDGNNDAQLQPEESAFESQHIKLTFEEIAAQSFVFFLGGFETSSTTISFCLFELSRNPNIQMKLREEVVAVLKKHEGKISYESIMDMKYMDSVVNETLRKYPPIPLLNRECTDDFVLPETGLRITKGTKIFIPVMAIQRDPEFYPDPDKFDPDRFSEKNMENRQTHTFIPFGEGPRICIGQRFGLMQTKVGLAVLLQNFEYTLNEKTIVPLQMDPINFFMSSKGGVWLNLKAIKN